MEYIATFATKNNNCVDVYENKDGSRTYVSDEVWPSGTIAWDTGLINEQTLLECVEFERSLNGNKTI